jgi:hypothetical protein
MRSRLAFIMYQRRGTSLYLPILGTGLGVWFRRWMRQRCQLRRACIKAGTTARVRRYLFPVPIPCLRNALFARCRSTVEGKPGLSHRQPLLAGISTRGCWISSRGLMFGMRARGGVEFLVRHRNGRARLVARGRRWQNTRALCGLGLVGRDVVGSQHILFCYWW